jgi:hypothetical protein
MEQEVPLLVDVSPAVRLILTMLGDATRGHSALGISEISNRVPDRRTSNEFTNIILDVSRHVTEEFEGQSSLEKAMGMPIMPKRRGLEVNVLELQNSGSEALLHY